MTRPSPVRDVRNTEIEKIERLFFKHLEDTLQLFPKPFDQLGVVLKDKVHIVVAREDPPANLHVG